MCASVSFFFFNDTATTEIYTLSLHDALPIYALKPALRKMAFETLSSQRPQRDVDQPAAEHGTGGRHRGVVDRKSTRLNSSHDQISYAVFCLKKKKHQLRRDHRARRSIRTVGA